MASSDTMELMGESFVSLAEKLPIENLGFRHRCRIG